VLSFSRRQQQSDIPNMNPSPQIIEAYMLGKVGTICPFTDGLLVDAWECGFIHAMHGIA
jgi:hypothetical protein